jgi:hypothetical protein
MLMRKYGPRKTESEKKLIKFANNLGISRLAEQLPVSQE